ncbi:hypothetical protein [Ekhidna sp.]|uniref:hypothetical protein n=1 Tax=Ekhidna sp. TaxID=2608089 RepID=UPI003BAB3F6F
MKLILNLLIILPVVALAQAQTAEELRTQDMKKYAIESAEIAYKISGDAEGEENMIFKDYGWTSLRTRSMTFELYGISSTQTLIELIDGDFVYRLSENDSTYTMKKDYKWSQQASYKEPDLVSEAILFSMGGQQTEADSLLLGKTCQVYTFEGKALRELWVWKGLVMKRKAKLGDRLIETIATKVEVDITPLEGLFEIPSYYQEKK